MLGCNWYKNGHSVTGENQYSDHLCANYKLFTPDSCKQACPSAEAQCTRPIGHDGMHEAAGCTGEHYASWYEGNPLEPKPINLEMLPDRLSKHLKGTIITAKNFSEKYKSGMFKSCPECNEIAGVFGIVIDDKLPKTIFPLTVGAILGDNNKGKKSSPAVKSAMTALNAFVNVLKVIPPSIVVNDLLGTVLDTEESQMMVCSKANNCTQKIKKTPCCSTPHIKNVLCNCSMCGGEEGTICVPYEHAIPVIMPSYNDIENGLFNDSDDDDDPNDGELLPDAWDFMDDMSSVDNSIASMDTITGDWHIGKFDDKKHEKKHPKNNKGKK